MKVVLVVELQILKSGRARDVHASTVSGLRHAPASGNNLFEGHERRIFSFCTQMSAHVTIPIKREMRTGTGPALVIL